MAALHQKLTNQLFDVIMMDPPWKLSSSSPLRGSTISYSKLNDDDISNLNIPLLQTDGFIFLWTINAKYTVALKMMINWGYEFYDEISWVKKTPRGKLAKGNGYYLQHSKEICLVGVKGKCKKEINKGKFCDCIFSTRRGQSQKPNEIYDMIEGFIPNGFYLEIFGRRNNLRDGWITIGNEL